MSDKELREALQKFFKHDEVDGILNQIRANDLSWFTQFALRADPDQVLVVSSNSYPFPVVRIKVAASNEDDCKDLTIIQGTPIYPREPDEESDEHVTLSPAH